MSDDPFFKLLKDGYSYNKPATVTKEKKIDDYYAQFKGNVSAEKASVEKKAEDTEKFQKEKKTITDFFASLKRTVPTGNNPAPTSAPSHNYSNITPGGLDIFKSRISPDTVQKEQILKDVYHNNLNHVYNTEVLPRLEATSMPKLKVTNIEDMMDIKKGPIELEIEPEFQDFRSKPKVTLLEGAPNVIEDVVYDDSVTDEIEDVDYENMQNYEYNGSSPERTPPRSPQMDETKVPPHHLDLFAFAKGKQRQPTLVELMQSSKKIQKKANNGDDELFNKMRDKYIESNLKAPQGNGQRRSPSPQPVRPPPGPTKEEMLEKLKQEMKQKGTEERAKAKAKEEEIKRKMMIAKRENEERMKAYKRRMQDDAETRLASLISSGGQMFSGADVMNVNQAINKQRKNVDGLLKFILGYRYYEQDLSALPTPSVPNEFEDFAHYQSCFQPLLMKEYISSISASLATLKRQKGNSKYVRCLMRVCNKIGEMDDDYSMIELKESKGDDDDQQMISFQNKNVNEVFDLKFANNYLVLISFSKEVDLDKINKDDYRNGFSIVGYMSSSEKANIQEIPKASTIINYVNMKRFLKKEWTVCYVRPIEKITTYIREYISLNCFIYSDVNKYIYNPRGVSNIVNIDNTVFYQKFFDTIKPKYNKGQLESIKDVCLSQNGICLLQGPPGTGKTHTLVGIVSGIYHYLKTSSATHRRYIMICTPSNAAVDEIILRIQTNGLFGENGEIIRPNVVRVGILDKEPHELVKKCALENLAQERMNIGKGKSAGKDEATVNEIRDEIAKVSRKIDILRHAPEVDKKALDLLYEKKRTLHAKYQDYKLTQVGEKEKYSQVVQSILYSADIICCTLTSAGSEKLDRFRDYIEAIIVDEASQCTEPSNIIPLQYSPKKLILIGDPKQLPATTFSPDSVTTKFSRSLFERIMDCGVKAFFLYEQYRMIANIRKFPSKAFYENRLVDAKSVEQRAFPQYLSNFENKNVLFLDLKFSKENMAEHSYFNKAEINVCSTILETLFKKLNVGGQTMKHKLGLISPYKKQVNMLNETLREKHGMKYREWVAVNTVDAFQGQEKDVILFSAVRASQDVAKGGSDKNLIGFLSDVRRLNVAITRPRFVLIIVGNSRTLATNETWRDFIESVAQDKGYISVSMEQEVEKVMRVMFRNEELPPYLTKSPELPVLTPRKPKKDLITYPTGGDDYHLYAPGNSAKNSVSTASTASGITKGSSVDNKDGHRIDLKKDSMKKESAIKRKPASKEIVQDGDDNLEVIEKKLKTESASRKPTVEKREEKKDDYMGGLSSLFGGGGKSGGSMVVEEDKPKTSSSELGGLSSLFGGGGGSKPKSSPTEGGLSSLFPKKPSENKTSKAKEPEDNSHSLLHRLFKF